MMRIAQFLFVAAFLTAGCSRARTASPAGGLSSEQFVSVMVELHQAQPHQRPSILEKFETTDAEIRAFVRLRSRDPSSLSEAFDSIQARIDRERFARQTE